MSKPAKTTFDPSACNEVSDDMKVLYSELRNGVVAREISDSLANVAGKRLKAQQLILAHEIRLDLLKNKSATPALEMVGA